MRELTSVELQAVAGGISARPPRPARHPLLRAIIRIVLRLLHPKKPSPRDLIAA
jgi:hypothetical protein